MLQGPHTSGFGYDHERKCVIAEKAKWDDYLKACIRVESFRV